MNKKIMLFSTAAAAVLYSSMLAGAAEQEVTPLSVAVGTAYNYNWDDAGQTTLCEVTYPGIYLMDECETKFPQLSSTMDAVNKYRLDIAATQYDELSSYAEDAKANGSFMPGAYIYKEKLTVKRADSTVLSLLFHDYSYSGGAHGYYCYLGENYDASTGQLIFLSDVIADMETLTDVIKDNLAYYWSDVELITETAVEDYFAQTPMEDISWTLDPTGITFYFNPYCLSSYAAGAQIITLQFSDYPDLFTGAYQQNCGSYGIGLYTDVPYYFDVDNDGIQDYLYITEEANDEYSFNSETIYLNNEALTEVQYSYKIEPTLLHMEDGRNYLYIENRLDNDYRSTTIFDLSSGTPVKVETYDVAMHGYPDFETYMTKDVLTTPTNYRMDTRCHILGTSTAMQDFYTDENGLPYPVEGYYTINYSPDLKLLQELNADVIDESGNITGSITLYPGAVVKAVRTDIETYADVQTQDGQLCRVYVDASTWPQTCNGIDIMEIFDGIIFAG